MRLLITTQAVDENDPALGFFCRWIEEFAKNFDSIEIICLKEGRHTLPQNVRIHSLGKERGMRTRVAYAIDFLTLAWRLRSEYDVVFVHMNPEYIALAGFMWKSLGKRIVLWYTHRQVNVRLRIGVALSDAVATAVPESLRIHSKKIGIIEQGIDTKLFRTIRTGQFRQPPALVSVGRITPIKRLETLCDALALLQLRGVPFALTLIGEPTVPSDHAYGTSLKKKIQELGIEKLVRFVGSVPYREMPAAYAQQDISVNLAPTGGMDKAVLESMAAGCLVLVANRAFVPLLASDATSLLFEPTPEALANVLSALMALSPEMRLEMSERLVSRAQSEADLSRTIERLGELLMSS